MTLPTSQKTYILATILRTGKITEQTTGFNGFRMRISELRNKHKAPLAFKWQSFTSQFGKKSQVKVWYIPAASRAKAIKIYNKINK